MTPAWRGRWFAFVLLIFVWGSPSRAASEIFSIEVRLGSGHSQIQVFQEGKQRRIKLLSPLKKVSKSLSTKNWHYLKRKLLEINTPSDEQRLCSGLFVRLQFEKKVTVGCLRSKTPTAIRLRSLANLLALYF